MSTFNVPVGSIVAYCGNREFLKNTNWRVCDGSRLERRDFPELYVMIGNANGGDDTVFNLPDLRGRFLRGASSDYAVGQKHDSKTANARAAFKIELFNIPNAPQNTSVSKGTQIQMMDVFYQDSQPQLDGNDSESRPDNMYMDYIIKYKNTKTGTRAADLVAGSVFPFTGADNQGPKSDPNITAAQYVLCSGENVVAAKYPDLQKTVGNRFATDKQLPESFTPPNLRNLFVRGIDDSGKVDPDYQHRKQAPDGSPDGRGTTQGWATKIKNPHFSINALNKAQGSSSGCTKAAGVTGIASGQWRSDAKISGGDEETRPSNVAIRFYLNAIGPAADKEPNLPIGGIIALPGTPDNSSKKYYDRDFNFNWIKCDGRSVSKSDYEDLAKLYKDNVWGQGEGEGTFRVPDLRSLYLRGTVPNGRATANKQDWATGRPPKLNNNPMGEWPHDSWNVARGGGNRIFDATGNRTFDVQADWDNETAPASVAVDFYVRASGPDDEE
ncbi:hypothetical protein N0V86_006902 [Didymella sp. IMI 355093]|nr:hypothetical protein N0V86_006902 [Didymella sp. IMI 355093]